ncbi:hypothetical protein H1C71_032865, partial [Ictidomys tridecemlineatus]
RTGTPGLCQRPRPRPLPSHFLSPGLLPPEAAAGSSLSLSPQCLATWAPNLAEKPQPPTPQQVSREKPRVGHRVALSPSQHNRRPLPATRRHLGPQPGQGRPLRGPLTPASASHCCPRDWLLQPPSPALPPGSPA